MEVSEELEAETSRQKLKQKPQRNSAACSSLFDQLSGFLTGFIYVALDIL